MKISHCSKKIVSKIIDNIKESVGKITVTRVSKHKFVEIDIEFNQNGTATLSMDNYIREYIQIYGSKIKRTVAMPEKGTLFDEDNLETLSKLPEERAEMFHHTTAKLLYAVKQSRIDIDLGVSFLCTKVFPQ